MWVRGLKPPYIAPTPEGIVSHPVWVRGLKLLSHFNPLCLSDVAPRVGAWIETKEAILLGKVGDVAPRVGAWIETFVKRKLFHKRYTYVMKYIFYGT